MKKNKEDTIKLFCKYCGYKIDKDKLKEHEEKYCDQNPKATNPVKGDKKEDELTGLGGWLVFPMIGFILSSLVFVYYTLVLLLYTEDSSSFLFFFLYGSIAIFAVYTSVLMLQKRKEFPKWAIFFLWYSFAFTLIITFIFPEGDVYEEFGSTFFYIIPTILWTWYFRVSKRVKNTFTK